MRTAAATVLLTTEGTYPYESGGVSVWCDRLIRSLPETRFRILAITGAPDAPLLFRLPDNVVSLQCLPLWGTEEPGPEDEAPLVKYKRKLRTTEAVIQRRFAEAFQTALAAILAPSPQPEVLGGGLVGLHKFARHYDYARAMASQTAWEIFLRACERWPTPEGELNLAEAALCMQWLARSLAVAAAPLPRADLAHASMAGLAAVPGVLLKLLYGAAFVLSEHGIYLRELYLQLAGAKYPIRAKRFLLKFSEALASLAYHFADQITTLCEFNRQWQVRLGAAPAKIRVVPNGADPAVFQPRRRPASHRFTVLTAARIFRLKGIHVLVEAARRVREKQPRVRFRILGAPADGAYYAECLERVRRLRLEDTVEFGFSDDMPSAYAEADVFCLPSISEAAPLSVLEAMFSGCPVVATNVGGVSEILGNTGVLVRPNDPEALAEGLLFLLEEGPEGEGRRALLSSLALARARNHFTWARTVQTIGEIYDGLLAARPASGRPEVARELGLVAAAGRP